MKDLDYIEINKKSWNDRVETHVDSAFYALEAFRSGENSLNQIELDLLGDIQAKSILHLQCHFGMDSISLSRLGASVTGVDFSDLAIKKARELADELATDTEFICSDIYSLPEISKEKYDTVFTSYGTIGWLPDIKRWAAVVSHFLKPGGKFIIADFHPVIWMLDEQMRGVKYRYFNSEPIIDEKEGTYTENSGNLELESVGWNHGLSEIIAALIEQGLQLQIFKEYDYSPYNCFKDMEEVGERCFRHKEHGNKLPYVYAIKMLKI